MAYTVVTDELDGGYVIYQPATLTSIPVNPANSSYQQVLDAIIAQGAAAFDGDIPADLQAAADAKLAAGLYQPDPHA